MGFPPAFAVPPLPADLASPALLVCGETADYRRCAKLATGVVLEVGSSFGEATALLAASAEGVCGVDISSTTIAEARRRLPGINFHCFDALKYPGQLLQLKRSLAATTLFVDLGGIREMTPTLELLRQEGILEDISLIVVKCRELHRLMSGQTLSPDFWTGAEADAVASVSASAPAWPEALLVHAPEPGETRICFGFLNGRCKRPRGEPCGFRHLQPDDPEAVADRQRRNELGWLPERTRRPTQEQASMQAESTPASPGFGVDNRQDLQDVSFPLGSDLIEGDFELGSVRPKRARVIKEQTGPREPSPPL